MTAGHVVHPVISPAPVAPTDPESLIADVATVLRARGERMTRPRRAVLTVLAGRNDHLSAEEIVDGVSLHDPAVHRASVYRTLETLSRLGIVQHVHVGHGGTAYHLAADGVRHPHVQCRVCGRVRDLPPDLLDEVAAVVAGRYGYVLDVGHVALSGTCPDCAARPR
jgi:Fur family ferric uptake transcriptional regulator